MVGTGRGLIYFSRVYRDIKNTLDLNLNVQEYRGTSWSLLKDDR